MKTLKFLIFPVLLLIFGSCSNEQTELENGFNGDTSETTRVDMKTALARAEKMFCKIEGGSTRSRKVAQIRYLQVNPQTRAGKSLDSLYYLINYADDGGFAVAGADTRLDEIYAISESGHLEESDVAENPELEYFFQMLPDEECLNMLGGSGMTPDSTMIVLPPGQLTDIDLSEKVGPFINPNVSKWSQYPPYNNRCIKKDGTVCVTGCVPLATAIIMSHYEWPYIYDGVMYDWNQMKAQGSYPIDTIAIINAHIPHFIRALGSENNYSTDYGVESSGSNTKAHYKRTFRHFGYKEPNDFKDYDPNSLQKLIKNSQGPVLIRGEHNTTGKGHAWVIDGYYLDSHRGTAYVGGYGGDGLMFHVIWGFTGSRNGYFKFGGTVLNMIKYHESWDDSVLKFYYLYDHEKYQNYLKSVQFSGLEYVGGFVPNKN